MLLSGCLVLFGYIMIFGQEYYWLEDQRILLSVIGIFILSVLMLIRFRAMKRPYIDLRVFRYRNFIIGLVFLFILYICRFASGITNTYFTSALHFDPFYLSYINIFNLLVLLRCYFGLLYGYKEDRNTLHLVFRLFIAPCFSCSDVFFI
jgi:hypothetical protein